MSRGEGRQSSRPSPPRIAWGHIYCCITGVFALLVVAWVVLTLLHHGGYYVRPFDNGGP